MLFLGDNRTFSISIGVLPEDAELKGLRHEEAFTAAVRATPLLADWLAPGNAEPISPVYPMGGLDNSISRQAPVAGFVGIGDAVCTTNPSYGRGVSLGLAHAFLLADSLAEHGSADAGFAAEFARRTEALVRPWYEEALANDRGRAMMWEATLHGVPMGRPPAGVVDFGMAVAGSTQDAVVWRRVANVMMMLRQPGALYADPEIARRIGRALASGLVTRLPGASRADLVAAIDAANRPMAIAD